MSIIKKHQCHSCGGELTAGNGKQMYYCASCGSTYDYEYFGEEQMRETGETHLSTTRSVSITMSWTDTVK